MAPRTNILLQYDLLLRRLATHRLFATFEITAAGFLVCFSFLLLLTSFIFLVNLNKTRHTALLESSYGDFPTRGNFFTRRGRQHLMHPFFKETFPISRCCLMHFELLTPVHHLAMLRSCHTSLIILAHTHRCTRCHLA